MKEASNAYAILINNTDKKITFAEELLNLARIQGAPSYLLLLYLSIKNKDLNWNESYDNEMKKIINLLTRFFVRRNLTDTPNTRSLTTLFMNIIEDIKVECNMPIYDIIKKKLVEVSASDDEFEKKLQDSLYDINKDVARFILCSLEQKYQTKEIYTNLWERDEKKKGPRASPSPPKERRRRALRTDERSARNGGDRNGSRRRLVKSAPPEGGASST